MRVHDSQAYRKMVVTRERISCILEMREILLSIQTGTDIVLKSLLLYIHENANFFFFLLRQECLFNAVK